MKRYPRNSPEAVSRIVAMALVSDAELDDRELAALDEINYFDAVGINKAAFANVFADYCHDLTRMADRKGRIHPLEPVLIDRLLDDVDDPGLQSTAMTMIASLLKADGKVSDEEQAVFSHIVRRWHAAVRS